MTTIRQRATPKLVLWPDGKQAGRIELGPWCCAHSGNKQLAAPEGSFNVDIAPYIGKGSGHAYQQPTILRSLRPGALISLGHDEYAGLTFGVVTDVAAGDRFGPGNQRSLKLSCADMGRILSHDNLVSAQAPYTQSGWVRDIETVFGKDHPLIYQMAGVLTGVGVKPPLQGDTVQKTIDYILKQTPTTRIPLLQAIGGSGNPGDYVEQRITTWEDARIWADVLMSYAGTTWGLLKRTLDEDIYELWIDTYPKRIPGTTNSATTPPVIALTARPKPFDEPGLDFLPTVSELGTTWAALKTQVDGLPDHVLSRSECMNIDLSSSDADVFTYLLMRAECDASGAAGLPVIDAWMAQRHGIRPYNGNMSLLAGDMAARFAELTAKEIFAEVTDPRNRLLNWYRLNAYFLSGRITVTGRDTYRVGDPLSLPWLDRWRRRWMPDAKGPPGLRFYVVGKSWSWALGSPYTVTLQVTRGHNASMIAEAKKDMGVELAILKAKSAMITVEAGAA